ncbi:MAG: hypothetical protein IJX17_05825 [Clostridia bacterium]|nr:hypothetical protein [Clostridia bacterium]
MKCEKIAIKKLEKNDITGNYLFSDDKNYYFYDFLRNSIFLKDKETKFNIEKVDSYYDYLTSVLNICKTAKNNPSVLYFGNKFESEELKELDVEDLNFNEESVYVKVSDNEKFNGLMVKLLESRSTVNYVAFKSLFVFIDDFTKVNENDLVRFVTISRSRNVYFVLLIEDENIFDEDSFKFIVGNCQLTFVYDENGIKNIYNRFYELLDKNKKEFVESKPKIDDIIVK